MTTTLAERGESPLLGRKAVVTGAGSGIGAATARALGERGASVALLGRRPGPLAELARTLDGTPVPADVTDRESISAAAAQVRSELGPVDLVVANAGFMAAAPLTDADPGEWRRMLEVNVMGALDLARIFAPDLLSAAAEGRAADLVLISSIGAHLAVPDLAFYFATKAAVTQAGRCLRAELGPQGVRVRVVEPGNTVSDLGQEMGDAAARDRLLAYVQQAPPIPATAVAETIAWSVGMPAQVNVAAVEILPTIQG